MIGKLGGYEILAHLGTGGQGDVFKARDPSSGQVVAIKQMWLGRDLDRADTIRQQWRRESRLLAKTDNPGVAKLLAFQDDSTETVRDPLGSLLIVYEFVSGSTLFSRLVESPPSFDDLSSLSERACQTVAQLHEDGIYHRDITPKNILLREDAFDAPILIDFGNVKLKDATTYTKTGHFAATPGYAPPELFWHLEKLRGNKLDWSKCDQWSLARTLLDCVAVAIGRDAKEVSHLRPEELLDDVRSEWPGLADVLGNAVRKDPATRYESVSDFAGALKNSLTADDSPISFTPEIVEELRRQLAELLSFEVDATMFSQRECFFSKSGASFRSRTQLVLWFDSGSRLRAAFAARNTSAVATVRSLGTRIDTWLSLAGDTITVILFNRGEVGSEPHGFLGGVLGDQPSTRSQRPNSKYILHALSANQAGVYFALSQPVRPQSVRLLSRGQPGPFRELINFWKTAASAET